MKIGIVLLLLVFGQFAYAEGDSVCQIAYYESPTQPLKDITDYVLAQCQDGDVLKITHSNHALAASTHCKLETIVSFGDGTVLCEFRKEAREVIRPSNKEWKQMKKNLKK